MSHFVKLFSSITESTVWGESYATRLVWITMLSMADSKGRVQASIPGLAHRARVTLAECETALETFKQPDRYSRTPDHEGRRIEDIDGGWRLLNYVKYREMRDEGAKREADAERQRRHRTTRKATPGTPSDECHAESVTERDNRDSHALSQEVAHVDVDVEVEEKKHPPTPRKRGEAKPKAEESAEGFSEFWDAYPRKASKLRALLAWQKLKPDAQALPAILAGIERDRRSAQWQRDDGQYIPHPATWLNGRRWEDETAERAPQEGQPSSDLHDAPPRIPASAFAEMRAPS